MSTAGPDLVGVPIRLTSYWAVDPSYSGEVHGVVVTGNRILGARGIGIDVRGASSSQIVENTFESIVARVPFPGAVLDGRPEPWEAANGAAIWIAPGSEDNEVRGNTFVEVAGRAVVDDGSDNRVDVVD
jgi:hypothetical protein